MESKTRTELFLTMLMENRTTEARRLLGRAEYELSVLPSNLSRAQKGVVKEINEIIARLNEGYDGSAIAKAKPAFKNFVDYRMHSFIKVKIMLFSHACFVVVVVFLVVFT